MKKHDGANRGQGRKPNPDKKVTRWRFMFRPSMNEALEAEAARRDLTVNKLVEQLVGQGLGLPGYG